MNLATPIVFALIFVLFLWAVRCACRHRLISGCGGDYRHTGM